VIAAITPFVILSRGTAHRADEAGMTLVILSRRSAAKDLKLRSLRPFASLRVTGRVIRSRGTAHRADEAGMTLVILSRRSAAKDLKLRSLRPFASLRVTGRVIQNGRTAHLEILRSAQDDDGGAAP
jgi:hypothetical protein